MADDNVSQSFQDTSLNSAGCGADADGAMLETLEEAGLRELLCNRLAFIGNRMRSVFFLRSKATLEAVEALCACLIQANDSSLLRHEVAYCLGQMQYVEAVPTLESVLRKLDDCPIVRHECAEAIAAIGSTNSCSLLREFLDDNQPEVVRTCEIAVKNLELLALRNGAKPEADEKFNSVDPAIPLDNDEANRLDSNKTPLPEHEIVKDMVNKLLDKNSSSHDRYRAMFSLRNMGSEESVKGLCEGLKDSNVLFQHEVAFVLGQMADPRSFDALNQSLRDEKVHAMVRHEAAEAIGAIASELSSACRSPSREDCICTLEQYVNDKEPIVAESCVVALDSIDYWQGFKQTASQA